MSNEQMTSKQYHLLIQLNKLVGEMNLESEEFKEMVNDSDIFRRKIEDFDGEIERSMEIVAFIKKYEAGDTAEVASIAISNSMSVQIIEAESDYVFGYTYLLGDKHYFLSEIEYKVDEEEEDEDADSVPMFKIGEDGLELSLSHAMRIG